MIVFTRYAVVVISLLALLTNAVGERWTDQSGQFSVDADFAGVQGKSVILVKQDGTRVSVPINKLSAASRERAKTLYQQALAGKPSPAQASSASHLINVSERSVFQPSPVKPENQWQYARIAETPATEAGNFVLLAGNARLTDPSGAAPDVSNPRSIRYSAQDTLINWHAVKDAAHWQLRPVVQSGQYNVIAHYGAAPQCNENQFTLAVGPHKLRHTVQPTGAYGNIQSRQLGAVTLTKGDRLEVSLTATSVKPNTGLLDLKAIELVPQATPHRWFDVVTGAWRRDIPASLRYPGKVCDQAPPAHLIQGGPKGYAVITTTAIRDHSKVLADFLRHKSTLGYDTMLITEENFGGGSGPDAADNIRRWLHENYQTRDLLYVLFIGNPDPGHGDIPMYPFATDLKAFREALAKGEHPHAGRPSDLPYADCSGATLDLNGDHRVDDYEAGKGLDTVWDVLVGRIPYYGEDSQWGRYTDVDAILQKTIDYDNASSDEILARYNFEIDGMVLDGHITEWAGFPYLTREQSHRGRLTLDHFSWQNNSFMDQFNVGFIRSGGHANPTFIESGITSGWLANRVPPEATCQVVSEFGGCDCSQPEHPMNMGYMHLRQGAIATVGASRSIASVAGHGEIVRPVAFHSIRRSPLMRGISVGQAHWQGIAKGRRLPNGGAQMWTLYGDPSVVPFPQRLHPQRDFALRPVHDLQRLEPLVIDAAAALHQQEYDLQNLSEQPLSWSASTKTEWVDLSQPLSGVLQPGEIATVKVNFNVKSRDLPAGMKPAIINFKVGNETAQRRLEYHRTTPKVTHRFTFDDKPDGVFSGKRDGDFGVFDRFDVNELENRSISLEIKPLGKLPAGTTIAAGPEFKLFVQEDQTVGLDWQPYHYGEQNWNWRFDPTPLSPPNGLSLRSSKPLLTGAVNRLTISTDFVTDAATLFLNGQAVASGPMHSQLFLPWKTQLKSGADFEVDNFIVTTKATTAKQEAQTLESGYPVVAPSPAHMQQSVNRMVTLRWETIDSINAIPDPSFEVFLGTTPGSLAKVTSTKQTHWETDRPLAGSQPIFWRVDIVSADAGRRRNGPVWQFETSQSISKEIIPEPLFAASEAWTSRWPEPVREPNGVISFRGYGHNLSQQLDPKSLEAGGYRLTFHASSGEQKTTRPMLFTLFGKDAQGKDVEFLTKTIELNHLVDGKVDTYFELTQPLTKTKSVFCRLHLPVTGTAGARSPYWVFGTQLNLYNNVDLSQLPNREPQFTKKGFELPEMPAKDNTYTYQFATDMEDEDFGTLRFRKLEGPEWITVQESGRVFSYYGAPLEAVGMHRMKVEITDQEGLTDTTTVTFRVHPPGELRLPATEAILSQNTNIRFTGNMITHITHDDATATWTFKPAVTGEFEVLLYAGSPDDNLASITINGQTHQFPIKKTGNYRNAQPQSAGRFHLKQGQSTQLVLGVVKRVDGLCDVSHLHLIPVSGE